MSVFVRQEKFTVRIGFQSDPIDPTKTRLKFASRSREVKKILDDLYSWVEEDPEGCIHLILRIKFCLVHPSRIYCCLFKNRLFLDGWKIGNVAPVPKGALSGDCNNQGQIFH